MNRKYFGCKVDSCIKPHHNNGYCEHHAYKLKRYGNPLFITKYRNLPKCSLQNCDETSCCKGLCLKHYKQNYYNSLRPRNRRNRNKNPPTLCIIENCGRNHQALGYCHRHYRRFRKYGDPHKSPKLNHSKICSIKDCNREFDSKGLCRYHYGQFLRSKNKLKNQEKYQKNKHILTEQRRPYLKAYYYDPKNHSRILGQSKQYYSKNRTKKLQYAKKYQSENPLKVFEWMKKSTLKLSSILEMGYYEYKMKLLVWSKAVRTRDNHTCQICGIRDEIKNIAHHLLYRAKYPELSLNLNNGITLCRKCHYEVHGKNLFK